VNHFSGFYLLNSKLIIDAFVNECFKRKMYVFFARTQFLLTYNVILNQLHNIRPKKRGI